MILPNVLAFQIQRTPGFSEDRTRRKKTDAGTAKHRDTEIQFPASMFIRAAPNPPTK